MVIADKSRFNYGICDVEENYNFYFNYLLSKLNTLFVWKNVPETIDIDSMNNQLFLNGYTCITKFNDKPYACFGYPGGKQNEYYYPEIYTIANPVLGSKTAKILGHEQDSVMVYNTKADRVSTWMIEGHGLFQLIKQTATLLADNIVSINAAQINSRVQAAYSAESEAEAAGAEKVIKDWYRGKPYKVVRDNELEKFTVQGINNSGAANIIAQLVELQQYIIGQFYMNIGIKYNSVNKKERLITDEINFQEQFLDVNINSMLESRLAACEEINKLFGYSMSCDINPILKQVENDSENNDDNIKTENSEESEETEDETTKDV